MNQSDDSYTREDDGSMDDSDATASNSDASSTFESDSGDDRDGSRDGASTYGRGRGRAGGEGKAGVGEDQEWEEVEGVEELTQLDTLAEEGRGQVPVQQQSSVCVDNCRRRYTPPES